MSGSRILDLRSAILGLRLYARIETERVVPKVRHYIGMPPGLSDDDGVREDLPLPDVIIIKEVTEGFLMYRYTRDGNFGGDTWHQSEGDAKAQAQFEYGDAVGQWVNVPIDVEEPINYAIATLG